MTTLPPIGLTGLMRVGKDQVANYLVQRYGYTRFAFGDGIQEVTRRLYPHMYGGNVKPRALLQQFGQMARSFDENVWVNDCFRRIDADAVTKWRTPVITDMRQPNEYDRCRAEGYVIIRISAPESLRIHRAIESADNFNLRDLTHETESHVAGFAVDYEIENSGTLAELYAKVDAVITKINEEASVCD